VALSAKEDTEIVSSVVWLTVKVVELLKEQLLRVQVYQRLFHDVFDVALLEKVVTKTVFSVVWHMVSLQASPKAQLRVPLLFPRRIFQNVPAVKPLVPWVQASVTSVANLGLMKIILVKRKSLLSST
jgi:hypothetical protein